MWEDEVTILLQDCSWSLWNATPVKGQLVGRGGRGRGA